MKKFKEINIITNSISDANEEPLIDKEISSPTKSEKSNIYSQCINTPNTFFELKEISTEKESTQQESNRPSADYIKTIFLHMFKKHPFKEDDSFPGADGKLRYVPCDL